MSASGRVIRAVRSWWIFKREAETLETVTLWTRGGASLWEHVFRATDAAGWVHQRVAGEIARVGL